MYKTEPELSTVYVDEAIIEEDQEVKLLTSSFVVVDTQYHRILLFSDYRIRKRWRPNQPFPRMPALWDDLSDIKASL